VIELVLVVVAVLAAAHSLWRVGPTVPVPVRDIHVRAAAALEAAAVRRQLWPTGPGGSRPRRRWRLRKAYSYRYVLEGAGTADEGDHDSDLWVVRADPILLGLVIVVRACRAQRDGSRKARFGRLVKVTDGVRRG
jgi:hypothetical protein